MAELPPNRNSGNDAWKKKHTEAKQQQESSTAVAADLTAAAVASLPPPSYEEIKKDPPRRPPPPGATRVLPASDGTIFAPPVPTRVSIAEPYPPPEVEPPQPAPQASTSSSNIAGSADGSGATINIPHGTSLTMSLSPNQGTPPAPAPVPQQRHPAQLPPQLAQPVQPSPLPFQTIEPLTYMDFTVGPLRGQMQNANTWLERNRQYQATGFQTLEVPRENEGNSFGDASNISNVSHCNLRVASNVQFIRFLRMWLIPRISDTNTQPFTFTDVIPLMKKSKKFAFEDLKETVANFNEKLKRIPLNGRILNIQTLQLKTKDKIAPTQDKYEENVFTWIREGDDSPEYFYLTYLRIFYQEGAATPAGAVPQIAYEDFTPKQSEDSKSNKDFENFSKPLTRAQSFLTQNADKRFINIQTVDHFFSKSPGSKFEAKTYKTLLKETDTGDIRQLRFVRLYYEDYLHIDGTFVPEYNQTYLNYKTFCPEKIQRETKASPPVYESSKDAWSRVVAWLRATRVRVIHAERIVIRAFPGNKCVYGDHEESFLSHRPDWNEFHLYAIRVHINGVFSEPPAHLLPPIPTIPAATETKSCSIM
ncbi:hypothetical protein CAPTEDRAFT_196296 [Capitella teleta]|uniref:Uncharacterized protein n=1 Tax=Capitella teleta TaxID=283909 RepID=R7T4R9_CAPTE|nr:hypothetical protein CAPTEDRAFT_196296 [Capitella teleta]|eukprot:ELT87871.1 hypothetical protein CAPTEDRAFT_196296 [Capitella teleta]